jgi:hypothetical protein
MAVSKRWMKKMAKGRVMPFSISGRDPRFCGGKRHLRDSSSGFKYSGYSQNFSFREAIGSGSDTCSG